MTDVLAGAEPFSAPGGPHGALVLHGFTGSPQSMRPLAAAFAAAGFATELPLLPGHGTTVEAMASTSWSDWSAAAGDAYRALAARCERVVVAGLSMGGTLTVWLAAHNPEIAGIVVVNGAVAPADATMRDGLHQIEASGAEFIPGPGNDVADPSQTEVAYDRAPVKSMLSLLDALDDLQPRLAGITCPALILTSPQDHVVPPAASDHLAASLGGPVTRVTLERSYHVATIDYDHELIEREAVAFAQRCCAQGAH